jgi:hypothetical protein
MSADPLLRAAQELARAAVDSSKETSVAVLRDSLDELRHLHGGVDKVLNAVSALADNNAVHSKAHTDALARVAAAVEAVGAGIADVRRSSRAQRIQWAMSNTTVGHFTYIYENFHTSSKDLVQLVLLSFNRGQGHVLDGAKFVPRLPPHEAAELYSQLINQLHGLLGEKPEVRRQADGKVIISLP